MSGVNKWIGIGNLTKDPEVRSLENGGKVANFSIACNESYKDKDGNRQESVEYVNIVLWRGLADVAEKYLRKGKQVYVEGKLQTRTWEDKEGNTRYTTEVRVDNLTMLGGKSDSGTAQSQPQQASVAVDEEEDDFPFA